MKTVELFCGTKSFSKVAQQFGHETLTSEIDPMFSPDRCEDILTVSDDAFKGVDMLWASPPCEGFSVASIGANWDGGKRAYIPKGESAFRSIALAQKTIRIIRGSRPTWWFIENPRGVLHNLQWMKDFIKEEGAFEHTIWYCKYGDTRAKPTNIWTNAPWFKPRPKCKNYQYDDAGNVVNKHCHHESARRGAKTGTQGIDTYRDRSKIPAELFHDVFTQLGKHLDSATLSKA